MIRLLVMAALLATALDASAQPKRGAAAAAQAKELYKKGMTHYQLGEFDTAIDEFKAAYELTSAPGLLFNLAQVHRMKKDWEQALHFYRMYLRLEPTAPNRADVEALIVEVQRAFDDEQRAKLAAPKVEPQPVAPPPPVAMPAPAPLIAPTPPPPPPRHWRLKLGIAAGLAAVGVGALATGIGLGAHAADDANLLANDSMIGTNAWDGSRQALYSEGQTYGNAAIALDVVGAAMIAAGVVVGVIAFRERAQAKRWSLAPSTHPGAFACAF
jgi:tetratricopeptide (TPR) repeat protein